LTKLDYDPGHKCQNKIFDTVIEEVDKFTYLRSEINSEREKQLRDL
jgi:hypothetical protein